MSFLIETLLMKVQYFISVSYGSLSFSGLSWKLGTLDRVDDWKNQLALEKLFGVMCFLLLGGMVGSRCLAMQNYMLGELGGSLRR